MRLVFSSKVNVVPGGSDLRRAPVGSIIKGLIEKTGNKAAPPVDVNVGRTLVTGKWKPISEYDL